MSCELLVVFFLFPWSSLNEDEQVRLLLSNKVWSRWPQPKFVLQVHRKVNPVHSTPMQSTVEFPYHYLQHLPWCRRWRLCCSLQQNSRCEGLALTHQPCFMFIPVSESMLFSFFTHKKSKFSLISEKRQSAWFFVGMISGHGQWLCRPLGVLVSKLWLYHLHVLGWYRLHVHTQNEALQVCSVICSAKIQLTLSSKDIWMCGR